MENAILDAAFELLRAPEVRTDPDHAHDDRDTIRIDELKRRFPRAGPGAAEEAYRRAIALRDAAIALADRHRSSGADFGPDTLEEWCPSFSAQSYAAAIHDGYLMTR